MQAYSATTQKPVTRDLGLTGQLVVGGTVSTGLVLGGYAVALLALAGRTSGHAVLHTSIGLFLLGALVGLVLSATIGLLGRDDGMSLEAAAGEAAKGLLYAIPAVTIGAVVAGWIAMAMVGLYLGKVAPVIGSAIAAVIAAAVILATARLTWEALINTTRRARLALSPAAATRPAESVN